MQTVLKRTECIELTNAIASLQPRVNMSKEEALHAVGIARSELYAARCKIDTAHIDELLDLLKYAESLIEATRM